MSPARRRRGPRRRNTIFEAIDSVAYPKHSRLKHREFRDLLHRAQTGDNHARNVLWSANARLVYSIANKSRFNPAFTPDVLQELQFSILRCIQLFNRDLGFEFSTYAFTAGSRRIVRVIPGIAYRVVPGLGPTTRVFRAIDRFVRLGDGPEPIRHLYSTRLISRRGYGVLAMRAYLIQAAISWSDLHPDSAPLPKPTCPVERWETASMLRSALKDLPDIQAKVLIARHGLGTQPPRTLEEIGVELGVTRERVRQIQVKAEESLRGALLRRGFDPPGPPRDPLPCNSPDLSPSSPDPEPPATP